MGRGGITHVARAAGVSRATIHSALHDQAVPGATRVRRSGGGRKKPRERDPTLVAHLEALVSPDTRGDPISPLRWTYKSTRQLASALQQRGYQVSELSCGSSCMKRARACKPTPRPAL